MLGGKRKAKELLKRAYNAPNGVKINYCLIGDRYPVEEFIDSMEEEEKIKILALFDLLGNERGRILNGEKFKKLDGDIYEFKSSQIRLACFTGKGYSYNLIYGFRKKDNKWPKKHLSNMKRNHRTFKEEEEKQKRGKR